MQTSLADGGEILFVGTKKQAQDSIKEEAERCGMYYVNERWLGGMLTNFEDYPDKNQEIKRYRKICQKMVHLDVLPKKEVAKLHEGMGKA